MTRCIGCGGAITGDHCASCQTPSRGARFTENVELHRQSMMPTICCCCLGPATTKLELRRGSFGAVTIAKVPTCRGCKVRGLSTRMLKIILWVVVATALAAIASRLAPKYTEYSGALALLIAIPLALGLTRLLVRLQPGHTPRCQPAKLGRDLGGGRIFEFRNRAFAQMLRAINPAATPMDRVAHAVHDMRERLGFPPSH